MQQKSFISIWWPLMMCYIVVLAATMFLQPYADDWFFLKYFSASKDWEVVGQYTWLFDCRLMPRGYWRPVEDVMFTLQTLYPSSFPYFNHFSAVTCAFISGAIAAYLGVRYLGIPARMMSWLTAIGMLMANNMGSLLSVDSITQTSATMFGLLSVAFLCSGISRGWRWTLWLLTGLMACLCKETGVVCFIIGPVFKVTVEFLDKRGWTWKTLIRRCVRMCCIGLLPAVCYLGIYVSLRQMQHLEPSVSVAEETAQQSNLDFMTTSQMSHQLTPLTFVKNIFIEYGAGIYPVDTSAVYYKNWAPLILTGVIGFGGVIFLLLLLKRQVLRRNVAFWGTLLMMIVASLPSMVTRAGEISPFISNMYFLLVIGVLLKDIKMDRVLWILLALWGVATAVTDIHKYSLAYISGRLAQEMAREIKALTPDTATRVMWGGPDEDSLDRAGAAFNKSPFKAFFYGGAVLREYDYKGLERVDVSLVKLQDWNEHSVDSLQEVAKERGLEYLWVTTGNKVYVYDLKNN